jgi:hypothetical protein
MFDLKHANPINRPTTANKPPKKPKKPSVRILRELARELARLGPAYRKQRTAHPALADYPTLDSLVEALTRYVPETKAARLGLIAALIDLHRESGDRVWATILLRLFRPMLNKIREKLVGAPADELDAALITAFLEALRVIDTTQDPVWIPKQVRWRTRRLVFRALKAETDWDDVGFGEDHEVVPDPCTGAELFLVGVWLRDEGADAESIELVRTLERGSLSALVRRRYPDLSSKEYERVYRRLQDKRLRIIARLRRRLRSEMDQRHRSSLPPPTACVAEAIPTPVEALPVSSVHDAAELDMGAA